MQLHSIVEVVGTGDYVSVPVPPYLDKAHLFVYVDGVLREDFEWLTANSISILAPLNGKVRVIRRTSPETLLTDYVDGQALPASALEVDSKQAFYLAQEAYDVALLSGGSDMETPGGLELTTQELLDLLKNRINFSQLDPVLAEMVQKIQAPIDVEGSVAWQVGQEALNRAAAIQAEQALRVAALQAEAINRAADIAAEAQARLDLDAQRAAQLAQLGGDIGSNMAAIQSEVQQRISADEALTSQVTSLTASLTDAKALVFELEQSFASRTEALARRAAAVRAEFQAGDADLAAVVASESLARADADTALGQRIDLIQASMTGEDATARAMVVELAESIASRTEALARRSAQVRADFQDGDSQLQASVATEAQARSDGDSALASLVTALDAAYKAADTTIQASVTAEATARANGDQALADQLTVLQTSLDTATASLKSLVFDLAESVSSRTSAVARRLSLLQTTMETADATLTASVTAETQARVDGDTALATQITSLDAAYKAADTTIQASVTTEATARANADTALSNQITALDAAYKAADTALQGNITSEATARANADTALTNQITVAQSQLSGETSSVKSIVLDVIDTLSSRIAAMARKVGLLRAEFEAGQDSLSSAIATEATVRADADSTMASNITTLQSTANSQGTRLSAVETSASTSATALGVVNANYTLKVQARSDGKYTFAGIGLNSTTNGTVAQSDIIMMADKFSFVASAADYNAVPTPLLSVGLVNGVSTFRLNPVTVGDKTLEARMIVDGGIEARHMKVTGEGTCINRDPYLADPSAWTVAANITFGTGSTAPTRAADTYVRCTTGTDQLIWSAKMLPCSPAKTYSLTAKLYAAASNARNMYIFVEFYNSAGTSLGNAGWGGTRSGYVYGAQPPTGVYTKLGGKFGSGISGRAIPSTAAYMKVGVWFQYYGNDSTTANVEQAAQDIRVEECLDMAALVVSGGVKADLIDTTGMVIRNNDGSVAFASGNALASSVTSAGTTATWSSVTGTGKPADNATVGATFGTNISGQITSGNVSTYIASAAIGNAQIGGDLWSTNFAYGSAGWIIRRDGYAEFSNVKVRGDIQATSVTAGIVYTDAIQANAVTESLSLQAGGRGAPIMVTSTTAYESSALGAWLNATGGVFGAASGTISFDAGFPNYAASWVTVKLYIAGVVVDSESFMVPRGSNTEPDHIRFSLSGSRSGLSGGVAVALNVVTYGSGVSGGPWPSGMYVDGGSSLTGISLKR